MGHIIAGTYDSLEEVARPAQAPTVKEGLQSAG